MNREAPGIGIDEIYFAALEHDDATARAASTSMESILVLKNAVIDQVPKLCNSMVYANYKSTHSKSCSAPWGINSVSYIYHMHSES